MNKDLFTILKELKNIQPDAQYSKHSLDLIFLSKENQQSKFIYTGAFNWIKLHRLSATIGSFWNFSNICFYNCFLFAGK